MRAAELLVRCLEREGVRDLFAVPGEENLDLLDALAHSSIRVIVTRHEQGAAFMADLHGRLTGRAGVCLSTLGPGATNLLTGLADANIDHAPVVAITGQADLNRMHKESHQYLDLVTLFKPVTKWNTQIKTGDMVAEACRKAFKIAQTEKPGSTHLDLPEDIAAAAAEGEPLLVQQPVAPEPHPKQLERAAILLNEARHPIVIAGNGVIRSGASDALRRFAERLRIPVAHTFMGKGALPDSHPLSLMAVGLPSRDYVSFGLERADLVITVGYDQVEYPPRFWNPNRDKHIIHIDQSPAEVDAAYQVGVGVLGDLSLSLELLAGRVSPRNDATLPPIRTALLDEIEAGRASRAYPLLPQKIVATVREALAPDDLVICDVGAHKVWMARLYQTERPNSCVISNGFASMGIAVPGAVAAKLLYPERKVVAVTGDGGFMMNSQELETACRVGTPFVTLIFNDGGYGLIQWKQLRQLGRTTSVSFSNPDFVKYAESFGAKGYRVTAADELLPLLREALAQPVPAVIDCPVDYRENLKLTERLSHLTNPL
ncbi:MAG: acetolactate synthase large subunit [Nitrospirae bacterium]|nr:acetolactate synthase large subunit [Nitrospirota bacterium]